MTKSILRREKRARPTKNVSPDTYRRYCKALDDNDMVLANHILYDNMWPDLMDYLPYGIALAKRHTEAIVRMYFSLCDEYKSPIYNRGQILARMLICMSHLKHRPNDAAYRAINAIHEARDYHAPKGPKRKIQRIDDEYDSSGMWMPLESLKNQTYTEA